MIPTQLIIRTSYLDKVKPFIGQNIIKIFTGQRRVGKSYMLFQIINYLKENIPDAFIIYINKEDLAFSSIFDALTLHDFVMQNKSTHSKTFLFIDEIQDIKDFGKALRSLQLLEDMDIYCTGSNAEMLSQDIAGHLSGRFIEIKVYSLSYLEFLQFHNLKQNENSLEKYLKYGGLPYLMHLPLQDDIVFEYLRNIYNTIVYRDIINRYAVRNVVFMEQLLLFLADNTGSLFSNKKISDYLKAQKLNIASNQVQNYILYFVHSFLIFKVPRYDIIGKRLFEIGDKYYFENSGIRNSIWGYRLEDRGKLLENVVYNHLLHKGYDVKVGVIGNLEIDFIASKMGEMIYFQVSNSLDDETTIKREFGNLLKIQDQYPKYVISRKSFQGNTYQGIQNLSLIQFLSNF